VLRQRLKVMMIYVVDSLVPDVSVIAVWLVGSFGMSLRFPIPMLQCAHLHVSSLLHRTAFALEDHVRHCQQASVFPRQNPRKMAEYIKFLVLGSIFQEFGLNLMFLCPGQ
jgi:hypothetical protein